MRRGYFVVLIFLGFLFTPFCFALESQMCVSVQVTSITPSAIEPDEDFNVGVSIENCGEVIPENITFQIVRFSPEITIREPLTEEIGRLSYSNSKRFLVYHMRTTSNVRPGDYVFETKLSYGNSDFMMEKYESFSVTVLNLEAEIGLSGLKTSPERITSGDEIILTANIENSGNGIAKDVQVFIEGDSLEGVKQSYLGKIEPDEELPARFILKTNREGNYPLNVMVDYRVSNTTITRNFPVSIYVFSKPTNVWWFVGPLLLFACLAGFFALKRMNRKELEEIKIIGLDKKKR